ncbi:MAG: tRNA pseudouridine(38-40) synthase TruA [Thermoanaerobaculia bacterium]|nr:tRNA pseudouridine(38-40) synthase TruA [Thermoanaerobaculia bacterium]
MDDGVVPHPADDCPVSYALEVSYRGTGYAGWQRQENALTVQEVLEDALETLTGSPVRVMGSGRTDRGVHARGQVASLRLARSWSCRALVHGTNRFLPDDIRVMKAQRATPGFDARRDALSKEYRYRLSRASVLSPLESWNTLQVLGDLDFAAIERATGLLVGEHDFSAFAKAGGSHVSARRRIDRADWLREEAVYIFAIAGQGFLRGMVRALIGTLLEVGRHQRTVDNFGHLLQGGERPSAGPNAPAHGLELYAVHYPTSSFSPL